MLSLTQGVTQRTSLTVSYNSGTNRCFVRVGRLKEFQLDPEQSTSAIIIHHPEAKYFNIE